MRLKPKAQLFISLSLLAVAVAEPQMATAQSTTGDDAEPLTKQSTLTDEQLNRLENDLLGNQGERVTEFAAQDARRSKTPAELRRDLDLQADACAGSGGGLNGDYQREVYASLFKDFRAFRAEREDLAGRLSRNEVGLDRAAAQRRIRELDEALAGLKSPNEIDCGDRELPGLAGDVLAYSSRRLQSGESDTIGLRAQLRSSDTRQPSLGQEAVGSGVPELDLVSTEATIQEIGFAADFSADLGLGPRLKFEAEYSRGEADKIILDFDPDGDARLLLPGPTGGASGLSLGDSAAFPNTATSLFATSEYQNWNVSVAAQLLNSDAQAINLGLRYEQSNINQSLSGTIPGFDGAFSYDTELDHDRFAAFIEAGTGWTLVENDSGNPAVTLGVGAEIEASHNEVSGQDSLNWSVFNGGTNGGGIEMLEHDQFSVTGSAFVELGVPLSDSAIVAAFAEGGIRVVPQIIRNGSDPTEVELDQREYWSVGVSLGIRY